MPSAEQLRTRLLKKLSELFQLDQPDLDFGFYRIMHAKAQEVQDFIGTDLLKIVADAFSGVDEARKAELQAAYEESIQTAKDFGAFNPEETEPVKKAKAALEAVKDTASAEADVYDHLYRFFERYYDDGDFISRRYYTRETSGKAAPFAVPYNGEEVKLHWANADQYYIKSAEYFSNFTFDLRQAQEIRAPRQQNQIGILLGAEDESPLKVHFRVVEATEGEHGNVKASEANKRFFILHAENPVALTETGELVVNFEYRPDPEKTGQENTWRDKRNTEAVETILERLQAMTTAGGEHEKQIAEYLRLFKVPAPTDSDKKRPVLAKYVNQYTARNTMDYFIHKDLGGFLRRELDFYIKNEVMRLDDVENAEAPAVESYLAKIKVLRKIAGKLIDFLAQLEDFQKKLWLKKKFIIETNYCITIDRVPEELFAEVAACDAQCEEWIKLFAIDEIEKDLHSPGFSRPLTVEFLKANNKLVLDTRFFDDSFKARLVASILNFDEQCDGLLIHGENSHALHALVEGFGEQVKFIYLDPPYNTGSDEFIYKDNYQSSSWLGMMFERLMLARTLLSRDGAIAVQISDREHANLRLLLGSVFGEDNFLNKISVRTRSPSGFQVVNKGVYETAEYIYVFAKNKANIEPHNVYEPCPHDSNYKYIITNQEDGFEQWDWELTAEFIAKEKGYGTPREARKKLGTDVFDKVVEEFSIENAKRIFRLAAISDSGAAKETVELKYHSKKNKDRIFVQRRINHSDRIILNGQELVFYSNKVKEINGKLVPTTLATNIWTDIAWEGIASEGGVTLNKGKKPEKLLHRLIDIYTEPGELVMDFFGGTGTTASVAKQKGRKFISVEQEHSNFESMVFRVAKYKAHNNQYSGLVKFARVESYEDTLNNLRLDHNPQRKKAVAANPALKEDYMLRYLLDVETRGSQSLLNIDAFADPTAYTLDVKKPGTDEYATRAVDLIETFNYLIGLRVLHTSVPQTFQATFKRITDPELPEDQHTKLVVDGRIRQDEGGPWWFRKVEGWVPKDAANPNNGQREKVLVVWRKLTDDIEQDNLMLDEWFQKNRISTRDFEFDTIYVNGSNNLPNLKLDDENWKVRLIEEEFMKRMWNGENA
ncbi:MAG: site-specific DNA-methyltransferase [Verrucomicrobiota bacterium]